jgi:hypothetical protein
MDRSRVVKVKKAAKMEDEIDSRILRESAFGLRGAPQKRNVSGVYSYGDDEEEVAPKRRATMWDINLTLLNRKEVAINGLGDRSRVVTAPIQGQGGSLLPIAVISTLEGEIHVGFLKNDPVMPVYGFIMAAGNVFALERKHILK